MADAPRRGLKFLPRNATRRSQADRAAYEQADEERRTQAAAAASREAQSAATRGSGRGRGAQRGRDSGRAAAGLFSGPSASSRPSAPGLGALERSAAVKVKTEDGAPTSPERKRPATKKKAVQQEAHSDDGGQRPRDVDASSSSAAGSESEGETGRSLRPMRTRRAAHVDRQVGINTEASSAGAATQQVQFADEQERAETEAGLARQARAHDLLHGAGREGKVFLFQLPALMPDLLSAPEEPRTKAKVPAKTNPRAKAKAPVAVDSSEDEKSPEQLRLGRLQKGSLRRGRVGTLSVYDDGRAVLDWGGVPMSVTVGATAGLPQEITLADRVEQLGEDAMDDGTKGWAHAKRDIEEKFVVSYAF